MFWLAQITGVFICAVSSLSYFAKDKHNYLLGQLAVNVLYCIQYLLLGAVSGAVSNLISIIKYIVFWVNAKSNRKNPLWHMFLFCFLSVALGLFAVSGWHTYIPILTALIFTYAIWQDNPVVLRIIVIICNIMWIVFNIYVKAYVSAVYSFVELIFAFVTMIKLLKRGNV